MSDYGDLDEFDPDDYNYFYVEDEYPLAVRFLLLKCMIKFINFFFFSYRTI